MRARARLMLGGEDSSSKVSASEYLFEPRCAACQVHFYWWQCAFAAMCQSMGAAKQKTEFDQISGCLTLPTAFLEVEPD